MADNIKRVDYKRVFQEIKKRKKLYCITLPIAVVLSCLWILPEPRFYTAEVMLAPESSDDKAAGGLSSLASSFGLSLGGSADDAIYPTLYPDLFSSPEFLVDLLSINVNFSDDEGNQIETDYYTYLTKYRKRNWLTYPIKKAVVTVVDFFSAPKPGDARVGDVSKLDSKNLSKKDFELIEDMANVITCKVDKKTDVTTITVTDQDRLVCTYLADSVKFRLQKYVTDYRTAKARKDVEYYQCLVDSAKVEYNKALDAYASYTDQHQSVLLQAYVSKRDALENNMAQKYETYSALMSQLTAAKAKVQEKTPVFTTLKSATAPVKPAGPKRMLFVAVMTFLTFLGTTLYILRDILRCTI